MLDALIAVNTSEKTNDEKLAVIQNYVNLESTKFGTVSDGNPLTAPTGYYLIKDNGPVGAGEAYSLYVVQVVGPTTIDPKVGTTTSEKKVDDKNDSNTTEDATVWKDSADYDIGDDVPFQLKATICEDYANYTKSYKLTFHDSESAGLTFNNDAKVYVDGNEITNGFTVVTATEDGDTFDVVFDNLKNIAAVKAGSVITVEYTSELNEQAVIGSAGNPNTSHITYTNNPNDTQAGENGSTPDDTVIVFTYKVVVNKVDENGDPLANAKFTLSKKNAEGNYVALKELAAVAVMGGEDNQTVVSYTASFEGIDDGDYKLSETATPAGYNTIADIEFTVTAGHIDGDEPYLDTLTGGELFTGEVMTGALTGDVENQAGSTLPETGGIGTYIFYAAGGVLVLAAVVLLVTKKRMSNAD